MRIVGSQVLYLKSTNTMAEETTPEAAYEAKLSDESGLNYRLIYFDIRGRAEHTRCFLLLLLLLLLL